MKIIVAMTLALAGPRSFGDLPGAAYAYAGGFIETFDSMTNSVQAPGTADGSFWNVIVNGSEYSQALLVAASDISGYQIAGFNAGCGDDRSLALGKSVGSSGNSCLTARFTNQTDADLTSIELYYDLEACWLRSQKSSKTYQAGFSVSISTNGTDWVALPGLDAFVSSAQADTVNTWLCDEKMDSQQLSLRNVGGTIQVPASLNSILSGQDFFIRWTVIKGSNFKNMTYGIDNLRGPADSDGDGLPDISEKELGTDPENEDSDGDLMPDGLEVAHSTNPKDSKSRFKFKVKPTASGEIEVSWPTAKKHVYTLYYSDTLDGDFVPVKGYNRKPGHGAIMRSINTGNPESSTGFYRIVIETE